MKCQDIIELLEALSPKKYACDWDNVGLLVGRKNKEINRILISLDASKEVVEYAVKNKVDMLITHHPMIFSAMKKINEDDFTAEKVLTLAEHGICYYAMHTNFDAVGGMAELAASPKYMDLSDVSPVEICDNCRDKSESVEGMGRYGNLPKPMTAAEVANFVKEKFHLDFVMLYQKESQKDRVFDKIAMLPGSGKSEMMAVKKQGYDLYLTGDFGHHGGIDAMDMDMTIIDATHYGLERIFIDFMVEYLKDKVEAEIVSVDLGCPIRIV